MQESGRVAAAIDVLGEILERNRPASAALADWGKSHRFAGSGDRSVIGTIVYDSLRRRASSAFIMGSETARAIVLGTLRDVWGYAPETIDAIFSGEGHAAAVLSDDERLRLASGTLAGAPSWVQGNYPEWLEAELTGAFGDRRTTELAAMSQRAPIDLRANTLKASRDKLLNAFGKYGAVEAPFAPHGVRIPAPAGTARAPNVEADVAHGKGWFEIQDEGSQIAAALAGASPRQQVLDLCAGAGGKTLAMAAAMHNTGQIYAYDAGKVQLRPVFERLKRAGARNVQVLDAGNEANLAGLGDRFDLVLADSPCTGSGVWRRHPDTKWRLKRNNLEQRQKEQAAVLALAAGSVKPGGRLAYVTCSILPAENAGQIGAFLSQHPEFALQDWRESWSAAFPGKPAQNAGEGDNGLLLSPATHGTDGFYVALMTRSP